MAKNVTMRLSDECARWIRKKAAEENTSVSRLVGQMLEEKMRRTDAYWQAFKGWQESHPASSADGVAPPAPASRRWSREDLYGYRR